MVLRRLLLRLRTCAAAPRGQARACARVRAIREEAEAARACARARVRAIREEAEEASSAAVARVRAIRAEAEAATGDAVARVRAIRAEAKAASSDAVAWTEERARAARACIVRHLESAADATARKLLHATDISISTFLRVAYGQSAPPTPSPQELRIILEDILEVVRKLNHYMSALLQLLEKFENMDPLFKAFILALVASPFLWIMESDSFVYFVQTIDAIVPVAPEPCCPFLGLHQLPYDVCPVEDGLEILLSMTGTACSLLVLTVGGLCLSVFLDLGLLPWTLDPVATPQYPVDFAVLATCLGLSSAGKKLKKISLMLTADTMSLEEIGCILQLLKIIGTNTSGLVTEAGLSRIGSELTMFQFQTDTIDLLINTSNRPTWSDRIASITMLHISTTTSTSWVCWT